MEVTMYKLSQCPCCQGTHLTLHDAVIAPFIASYTLKQEPQLCELAYCKSCGLQFFLERFSDDESKKLYNSYRQEDYFLARNKFEFWYTRNANNSSGENTKIRRCILDSFLIKANIDLGKVKRTLDYGGDQGQFFPNALGHVKKWIYDLSNYTPIPGVQKIDQLDSNETPLFQFVMMCHLLEHISEPNDLISKVCQFLEVGGYLYIEVPEEQFKIVKIPRVINQLYINCLLKHMKTLKWIDLLSLAFRLKLRIVPPFALVKLHEHINFFSHESIVQLLKANHLKVIKIETTPIAKQSSGRNRVIQCIAQKVH